MRRGSDNKSRGVINSRGVGGSGSEGATVARSQEPVAARRRLAVRHIVDMITESDEQVEEELAAAVEHVHLHGAAALEGSAAADDEGEVVGTQLGVGIRSVCVGVAGGRKDDAALNAGFCRC